MPFAQAAAAPSVHQHRPYNHNTLPYAQQPQQQHQQQAPPPPLRSAYAPPSREVLCGSFVTLPDGRSAMVVVDPLTRKLSIPCEHILETKAQQRQSIPSLCQLFLAGRCRQAHLCHQVHADPYAVHELRLQVERLPVCCVEHGDFDFIAAAAMSDVSALNCIAAMSDASALNPSLSVRIPNLSWNDGCVPIRSLSYTQGLRQLLLQAPPAASQKREVLDLTDTHVNMCRLHIIDRCRFAEDCKFLHVCKHVMQHDMQCFSSQPSPHNNKQLQATTLGGGSFTTASIVANNNNSNNNSGCFQDTAAAGTPPPTPPKMRSTLHLSLMETEDGRAATPDSANDSTAERSIASSGSFGSSQLQISPHSVKKFRTCGSWSYDPYSAAYTSLVLPPALSMS